MSFFGSNRPLSQDLQENPPSVRHGYGSTTGKQGFECPLLCGMVTQSTHHMLIHLQSFKHLLSDLDIDMIIEGWMFPKSRLSGAKKPLKREKRSFKNGPPPLSHDEDFLKIERAAAVDRTRSSGLLLPSEWNGTGTVILEWPPVPQDKQVHLMCPQQGDDCIGVQTAPLNDQLPIHQRRTIQQAHFNSGLRNPRQHLSPPLMRPSIPARGTSQTLHIPSPKSHLRQLGQADSGSSPRESYVSPYVEIDYCFESGLEKVPASFVGGSLSKYFELTADRIRSVTWNLTGAEQLARKSQLWREAEERLLASLR